MTSEYKVFYKLIHLLNKPSNIFHRPLCIYIFYIYMNHFTRNWVYKNEFPREQIYQLKNNLLIWLRINQY